MRDTPQSLCYGPDNRALATAPCVITETTQGRIRTASTTPTNLMVKPNPLRERVDLHAHRVSKRRATAQEGVVNHALQ